MIKEFNNPQKVFASFIARVNAFLTDNPTPPAVLTSYNYIKNSAVCYSELKLSDAEIKVIVRVYVSTGEVEVTVRPCKFNGEIENLNDLEKAKQIFLVFDEYEKEDEQ